MSEPRVTGIVQARMSSSRFPGKVLALFRGEPILEHVVRAVEAAVGVEATVIATSTDATDDAVEVFARRRGTALVRGELANVMARFQRAAALHPREWVLRVGADSPLVSPATLRALIAASEEGSWDVITTTQPRTFPKGCNAELIRCSALTAIDAVAAAADEREHVTRFFYNRPSLYRIKNIESGRPELASIDLAVDEPDDLVRLERLSPEELSALLPALARG